MKSVSGAVIAVFLSAVSIGLLGCASGSSYAKPGYDFNKIGRLAVIAESPGLSAKARKEVADLFAMEVLKKGYNVVDRANMEELMGEERFQSESGITSAEGRAKLKVLNVATVVVVNVRSADERVAMTSKMVDLESGEMVWAGEGTGKLKRGMGAIGGAILGGIAGSQVTGGRPYVGAAVGAAAGAVIGNVLEPEEADILRSVIKDVCEDMPARR